MFDCKFYTFCNPELSETSHRNLKEHFDSIGWKEGRDPSAKFNMAAYIQQNIDVAKAKINPLAHYLKFGKKEGRQIFLSSWNWKANVLIPENDLIIYRPWIDVYSLRLQKPELAELDDDTVLCWFLMNGWREGIDPSDRFSTQFYLTTYTDLEDQNINPLVHYLQFGLAEGHFATRAEESAQANLQLQEDTRAVQSDFDADWYRASYHDVNGDDNALLHHYMTEGWKKKHDPSAIFSTAYYLEVYHDIEKSGANPFLHYVLFGRKEGRRCSPEGALALTVSKDANLTPGLPDVGLSRFVGKNARPPRTISLNALDIHWVVPDFRSGSGGMVGPDDAHCARQQCDLHQCASRQIAPDNQQAQFQLLSRSIAAPPFSTIPSAHPSSRLDAQNQQC